MTTRAGGVSAAPYASFNLGDHVGDDPAAVTANRARLASAVGLAPGRLVWLRMVHGARVATVREPVPEAIEGTDAAVTDHVGLGLVVHVADCVPVLLADPVAGVVGVAHAGRAGSVAGVVPATVSAMAALGARAERVEALLGPAICGACYEVPEALRAEAERGLPGSSARTRRGTPGIDLRAGLRRQLDDLGVASVATDPACTHEDQRFYSYRRDGVTGRFAGVVFLEEAEPAGAAVGRGR